MEDFLRQRFLIDGRRSLNIKRLPDGRFQANLENPDRSWTVDVGTDPADALWNVLVPHTMRRTVPSGRAMALADAPPVIEVDPLASLLGKPSVKLTDEISSLLG